jgi:subtilisin family serine protease
LFATFVLFLSLSVRAAPAQAADAGPTEYVPNQVIVRLKPLASVATLLASIGHDRLPTVLDQLDTLPIYLLQIADGTPPPMMAALLEQNPLVVYAEPNFVGEAPMGAQQSSWSKGGDDPGAYQKQWAPKTIGLPDAHMLSRGAGITVAVLDTGVDRTHPAVRERLAPGFDFVDGDADPSEEGTYGQDHAYGHGTHVSGLIVLAAPDARVMPLRILKPDGTGNSWLLAQAVRYAAAHQAQVVNLSYSVRQRSRLIDETLAALSAGARGAVVVAAAGNSASSTPEYPAAEGTSGLLAVAASTKSDQLASFSAYGAWVHVAAPGDRIVSGVPLDSGRAYAAWSGTSMAAPLVAGTAALIRAAEPGLSPAEVARRITATAAPIDGPVPRRLDAAAALRH